MGWWGEVAKHIGAVLTLAQQFIVFRRATADEAVASTVCADDHGRRQLPMLRRFERKTGS